MVSRRTFTRYLAGLLPFAAPLPVLAQAERNWVERTLASLDLEGRIGQLLMPMLETPEEAQAIVRRFRVGGFICYRSQPLALATTLNKLQAASPVPLLVSADFERGVGGYIDGATDLPVAMALGAAGDEKLAYQIGAITAREARALGVHVIFAPVLDVNNNPRNPIINVRSYGESPEAVARLAAAMIAGLEETGTLATAKHFPGHGNVSVDTHREFGALPGSLAELERVELLPYRQVLNRRAPHGIMATHLWVRALDREPVPATLSARVLGSLLRQSLGFDGLIYTDSMGMQAVLDYAKGDAARAQALAVQAGCDVVVIPVGYDSKGERTNLAGVEQGIRAIRRAVEQGEIARSQLENSVRRVLAAKARLGLDKKAQVDPAGLSVLGAPEHQKVAEQIARRALTLVQDQKALLPLDPKQSLGVITLTNREGAGAFARDSADFVPELHRLGYPFAHIDWGRSFDPNVLANSEKLAASAGTLVVAAYLKVFVGDNSTDLPPVHREALRRLHKINPRIVFISFGSPYALAAVRELSTLICAYDDTRASQVTAARALFAREALTGRLPVGIELPLRRAGPVG